MENITSEKMTARKLCTAFGVKIPKFLEDAPDENFYQLLGLAINRELNKRPRLAQYKTIDDAAKLLRERTNIMVITGAGISTSLGIPDFRSKNTGFYSRLRDPISRNGRPRTSSSVCCRTRRSCSPTTPKTLITWRHMPAYARRSLSNVTARGRLRRAENANSRCQARTSSIVCARRSQPSANAARTRLLRSQARSASGRPMATGPGRSGRAMKTPSQTARSTSRSQAS